MEHQRDVRAKELAALPMRPAGPRASFFNGTIESMRDIWSHRELLGLLTSREIKARYKDSTLGFFWSLAKPLAMLLVYYIAIGKFLGAAKSIPDFAIFIFAGLTAWQLFSDIVTIGTGSIVANGGLIKKVYLPREVFPLSIIGSALFNFAIQVSILIGATAVLGQFPTGSRWLYFVLAMAIVVPFSTALALLLSATNVYLRDVAYLVEIMLMILMWASPIIYSWKFVRDALGDSWLLRLYDANPMTQVVMGFQKAFWVAGDGQPFPPHLGRSMVVTFFVSLALLWLSQRVFARLQSNFAQEL
jgi:ABC-2 type transport system permease protein